MDADFRARCSHDDCGWTSGWVCGFQAYEYVKTWLEADEWHLGRRSKCYGPVVIEKTNNVFAPEPVVELVVEPC